MKNSYMKKLGINKSNKILLTSVWRALTIWKWSKSLILVSRRLSDVKLRYGCKDLNGNKENQPSKG